jgi:outer membrane protein OmpA-like peptidoglycan-associated protein
MADIKATAKALGKGIKLRIGNVNVVRLQPPPVSCVRLIGMHFDLYKSFMLPTAIPGIKEIKNQYAAHPSGNLLVVGHTDTSGTDAFNLTLSLERANAVGAYLKDDMAAWDAFFSNKADEKRWGTKEIQSMLTVLPEGGEKYYPGTPSGYVDGKTHTGLKRFQGDNGIKATGTIDLETRQALIIAYMGIDATKLPGGITLTTHGCGENFPADSVPNGVRSPDDRRVEVFLFDGPIVPVPGADQLSRKGAVDYPSWLSLVTTTFDFLPTDASIGPVIGARLPTQFTLGSSFPKPSSITTLKAIKDRLAKNPALKMVLMGHADLKGNPSTNDPLSLSRAKSVRAWLTGDADYFRNRFESKDPVKKWSWSEIQWMLLAVEAGGTPCYVGQVDGHPGPATHRALEYFQFSENLKLSGLADETTLTTLIARYLQLLGSPLADSGIEIAGGGEDHPPLPFGTAANLGPAFPDSSPLRARRVEVFLFNGAVKPPVSSLSKNGETYRIWCHQVNEEITDISGLSTTLSVVDGDMNPLPGLAVEIFEHAGEAPPENVASATSDGLGQIKVTLPEGFYSLEADFGGNSLKGGLTIGADQIGAQMINLIPVVDD